MIFEPDKEMEPPTVKREGIRKKVKSLHEISLDEPGKRDEKVGEREKKKKKSSRV